MLLFGFPPFMRGVLHPLGEHRVGRCQWRGRLSAFVHHLILNQPDSRRDLLYRFFGFAHPASGAESENEEKPT